MMGFAKRRYFTCRVALPPMRRLALLYSRMINATSFSKPFGRGTTQASCPDCDFDHTDSVTLAWSIGLRQDHTDGANTLPAPDPVARLRIPCNVTLTCYFGAAIFREPASRARCELAPPSSIQQYLPDLLPISVFKSAADDTLGPHY